MGSQLEIFCEKLNSTPFGRDVYRAVRSVVRVGRKIVHPSLPTAFTVRKVTCRGRQYTIFYRRTYADKLAIKQCFGQEQYNMPGGPHGERAERHYRQIIAQGKQPLILDCGANIGTSVLWFAARYPEAHIVAVEPAPDNFALLKKNCAGLDVDLREAGIGAEDGIAHLTDSGLGSMAYRTTFDATATSEMPGIAMTTMATLLESKPESRYVPFLLKVDIEGGEKSLFEGDCSMINRFPLIIMEPHDWILPGEGTSISFFRFHANAAREFCMKHENIASIAVNMGQGL